MANLKKLALSLLLFVTSLAQADREDFQPHSVTPPNFKEITQFIYSNWTTSTQRIGWVDENWDTALKEAHFADIPENQLIAPFLYLVQTEQGAVLNRFLQIIPSANYQSIMHKISSKDHKIALALAMAVSDDSLLPKYKSIGEYLSLYLKINLNLASDSDSGSGTDSEKSEINSNVVAALSKIARSNNLSLSATENLLNIIGNEEPPILKQYLDILMEAPSLSSLAMARLVYLSRNYTHGTRPLNKQNQVLSFWTPEHKFRTGSILSSFKESLITEDMYTSVREESTRVKDLSSFVEDEQKTLEGRALIARALLDYPGTVEQASNHCAAQLQ